MQSTGRCGKADRIFDGRCGKPNSAPSEARWPKVPQVNYRTYRKGERSFQVARATGELGARDGKIAFARYRRRRVLVRLAFLAAADRPLAPFVFAALLAAAERAEALRREAARRACFESAARDAVPRGSRLRTCDTARETRGRRRVLRLPWPAS
jgi:hypothetical protein